MISATAALALAAALGLLAPSPGAAAVRPVYGGELRIALPAAPREVDPALAWEPADLALARAVHATLLEVDASGALVPGLLESVPEPQAGGRAFRLALRPGLRFSDGTPLQAADVAASLARLASARGGAVHGALVAAIQGADLVRAGKATALSGVQVLSDRELLVSLAFPLPELPWALAAIPTAIVSPRGAGAGPFRIAARDAAGIALVPNEHHHRGRPFADAVLLAARDARHAARALERGELALALRPEAIGAGAAPLAPTVATYAVVNGRRLGAVAEPVRRALAAIDRAELARLFVRGPAEPLASLLPARLAPVAARAAPPPGLAGALPARVAILAAATADAKAAAQRIQVKLFDRGVRAALEAAEPARVAARIAAGDFEVAVVPVPIVAARTSLAAAEVAWALGGPAAARGALASLAGLPRDAAASELARLARALDAVPLFASGLRASAGPALQGLAPRADGSVDLGDLWLLPRPTSAGGAR